MPTIKFKLKDPKCCKKNFGSKSCPCLIYCEGQYECGKGFFDIDNLAKEQTLYDLAEDIVNRPKACIDKYGE